MDEGLSWRARFAKANINILNVNMVNGKDGVTYQWFVEFTYHPKPGVFKWCKTYITIPPKVDTYSALEEDRLVPVETSVDEMAQTILDRVLELRKELEG